MALDDRRYEQLCRAIEVRSGVPLSRENREFLRTITPEAADQFMADLGTPYEQPAADEQAGSGVPWWFIAAVLAPTLALTGLWGWFAPFTDQTPAAIELLIIVMSILCVAAGLVLDLMMRRFYVSCFLGVVLLLLGGAAVFGWSDKMIREVFGQRVNLLAAAAVVTSIFVMGEVLNMVSAYQGERFWEKGRSRWKSGRYLTAALCYVVAVFAFCFGALWPFKVTGGEGGK